MKKYGPKDITYAALYAPEDRKLMQYLSEKDPAYLTLKFEERWNDHKTILRSGNKTFELVEIAKAEDVVTYPGLALCMRHITGAVTSTRFTFMCVGTEGAQARPYQQDLLAEVTPRVDMTLPGNGSIVHTSTAVLTFTGNFPVSFPTALIAESAVCTPSGGTMLNRSAFPANGINHVSGGTAFTIQSVITFSAVDIWE